MRFSKKSEYALRALLELTQAYGHHPIRRIDIAERQHIPLGFLEGILLQLKHAGILTSRPGVDGGFRLRKKPEEITLGSIIRALDGPLAPISCASQTAYQTCEDCPYATAPDCPIRSPMLEVRNAIAGVLDNYSLQDFAERAKGRTGRRKAP